jgi:hypothetical protein
VGVGVGVGFGDVPEPPQPEITTAATSSEKKLSVRMFLQSFPRPAARIEQLTLALYIRRRRRQKFGTASLSTNSKSIY